ncbi:MAG: sulfatase [Candidatus Hydrogenedentes bacterium]|nr:sulfatase [Candidatus Hydrogenedentota bacterium]
MPITPQRFICVALVIASVPLASLCADAQDRDRPNIVYVFSDEHRYQSMGHTEMPEVKTPVMDRMAAEGFSFTQCVSNYPVCSPYRAIAMSGRWPYQTGVIDNGLPLSPAEMTVGKAFQAAGYRTGYIGKWHLGGTRAEPFGFDRSLIWEGINTHYDKGVYFPAAGEPVQPKGYNATLMTDQAIDFIRENRERPFFLMLSINPPHADFTDAPPEKRALYPEGSLPFRPNFAPSDAEAGSIFASNGSPFYEGYHAHISAVDDELGRLLDTLESEGIAEDTIVIYTSDHGSMHGSHAVGSKRQPYEESLRIPMIVYGPGRIPGGAASPALIGAIDMAPTLCGLAGIEPPAAFVGGDYSGVLRGEAPPARDAQFIMHIAKENASHGNNHPAPIFRGVRTARYTYAVGPEGPFCLFDNQLDPYQMNNLIADREYAALREELEGRLRGWLREAEDPFTPPAVP